MVINLSGGSFNISKISDIHEVVYILGQLQNKIIEEEKKEIIGADLEQVQALLTDVTEQLKVAEENIFAEDEAIEEQEEESDD